MSNTGRIFALLSNDLDCPLSPCALGSKRRIRLRIMDRPMRNKLISSLAGAAFSFAASGLAVAADMPVKAAPPPPVFSWTGFYIGAGIGGAWSSQDANSVACANTCGQAPASAALHSSSALGGFYAGYNWMLTPQFLLGVEGDWNWTHLNSTATAPSILLGSGLPDSAGSRLSWSDDTKWLASIRGRLGWAPIPNALLYATGGAAWAGVDYGAIDNFSGGCPNCTALPTLHQTQDGYTVGGGVEWAPWSNNWLFRVEYLYYRFKGTTANAPGLTGSPVTFTWGDLTINTVSAGVAYKF